MMDLTLTTLVSIPAILAVINILKDLGLPTKLAPVVAILTAVAFSVAQGEFGHTQLYREISEGILLALAASGVYDVTKTKAKAADPAEELAGDAYSPARMAADDIPHPPVGFPSTAL